MHDFYNVKRAVSVDIKAREHTFDLGIKKKRTKLWLHGHQSIYHKSKIVFVTARIRQRRNPNSKIIEYGAESLNNNMMQMRQ